jgi:chromate transporter
MTLPPPSSSAEIFTAFLRLGATSFGGPVAHLEYLRREFVERRGWIDSAHFGQLLAVCQLLPGPASSQLGFGIGLLRGGWRGALVAFAGFTLPSVLLLLLFVQLAASTQAAWWPAVVHGLKLVAVAVVAHGVVRMAQSFTPDWRRAVIALAALVAMLWLSSPLAQLVVIAGGAALGAVLCRTTAPQGAVTLHVPYGARGGVVALGAFGVLLIGALVWPASTDAVVSLAALGAAFTRAGALVFGGGHVVLPLLDASLVEPGWMTADQFLTGYGAAQAVPGPLFSVAAYLGAVVPTAWPGLVGAVVATLALFAPGFLLLVGVLPAWSRVRTLPHASAVLAGINASVVGLLAAALYDPIVVAGVRSGFDAIIAAMGFVFLLVARRSPLWVVAWCVGASLLRALSGG